MSGKTAVDPRGTIADLARLWHTAANGDSVSAAQGLVGAFITLRSHANPLMPGRDSARRSRSSAHGIQIEGKRSSARSAIKKRRVSTVVLLPPGFPSTNPRRMADVTGDSELVHYAKKPPHRPRGLDADHDGGRQRRVKLRTVCASCFNVPSLISPVSRSSIAITCWLACKSHPIIRISASSLGPPRPI